MTRLRVLLLTIGIGLMIWGTLFGIAYIVYWMVTN